jgi:hypothetical protein
VPGQSAVATFAGRAGQGRVGQGCHGGQSCDWIIAQRGEGFPRRVTGALHGPFVVLLQEDGPSQASDGVFVRRCRRPRFGVCTRRSAAPGRSSNRFSASDPLERHVGENIGLGHEGGELWERGA